MKIVKRLLIAFGALIILLIGAAVAIPYFYKSEILDLVKVEINKNLRAEVAFDDINLTLLRTFPDMGVSLDNFSVTGVDTFQGLNLFKAKNMALSLDLMSVIKGGGEVQVNEISLDAPDINVLILQDGLANYDIAIPTEEQVDTAETTYTGFALELDKYSITNGRLVYDDHSTDTYLAIAGLNHEGSGNFTLDVYDLDTHTTIDSLTARQGGIGYLSNARTALDAIFNIDMPASKYTLKDNKLKLNELELSADGFVQLAEEDINMDLSFKAPANDFRQLWSIIPNAYIQGYEQVKISGQFTLDGLVKGVYNEQSYPSFKINTTVSNGNVKYPDLPMSISSIDAAMEVNSPGSELNDMVINLSRIKLNVGGDPFSARFLLRTPLTDPDIDMSVDGVIDLAKWAKAFPIPDVERMAGRIVADVDMKTRLSTIEREAYEEVDVKGDVTATGLQYKGVGLPLVDVRKAVAAFTPQRVAVSELDMKLGRSDLRGSGEINNILAYFSPDKTMTGQFKLESTLFDADEWMEEEAAPEPAYSPAQVAEREAAAAGSTTESTEIFDRFDFDIDALAREIRYDVYQLKDTRAAGRITPNRMEIREMSTIIGDSDLRGSGLLLNAFDYAFGDGVLGGNFEFESNYLNLNQFMTESETAPTAEAVQTAGTEALDPILVPDNISVSVAARAKKIDYTNLSLNDFNGTLLVRDEQVVIEEGNTRILGGKVAFGGAYDTQDEANPYFNFKYDLQGMDFQQSFSAFNTFQQLAPIGKFIQGKFTTSMVMEGVLGKDMMPNLATLNADGFLETLNGIVNGFAPLTAIGNTLEIKELKEAVQLNNLKSWFSIRNGAVEVKPFDLKVKDIAMNIGGTHSITQEMNYQIKTVVPRSKLTGNAVGQAVNKGVGQLLSQAASLGVNVAQSENINVLVNLTGSIAKPKVSFKLLGADGQTTAGEAAQGAVANELNNQKQQLQDEAQKRIDDARTEAENRANKALDSAKVVANQKLDELQRQAGQAARDKAGTIVDSATLKRVEQQGQQTIDQIKDNLQQWNPLKRKRGGG